MEDVLDERDADDLAAAAAADLNLMAGCHSSNLSTCSDPAEMDVLYLQTSVVPDLHFPGLMAANSTLALGPRGLLGKPRSNPRCVEPNRLICLCLLCPAGREDSVSIGSSVLSLAERGTNTPARQRTVTEVSASN